MMMVVVMSYLLQGEAESQCQFMYTKRMFGWEVSDYSFYSMIAVIIPYRQNHKRGKLTDDS